MAGCRHCIIWLRYRDGQVQRGCPHCWHVIDKHDEPNAALALRQVQRTIEAHAEICPVPVRWGQPAAPRSRPAGVAAARRRAARR